jgi:lysozyme
MSFFKSVFDRFANKLKPAPSPAPVPQPPAPQSKLASNLINPQDLRVSDNGRMMVAKFEGCRLKAYQDVVGVWTIGYGQTKNVTKGMVWTQQQANDDLLATLTEFGKQVASLVRVPIYQNQFDALVSFTYNVGVGNFKTSTLLRKVNACDFAGAHDEFVKWNKAGGKVITGLTRRRLAEAAVFASDETNQAALARIINEIMMLQ